MRKQCTAAHAMGAPWLKVTGAPSAARVLALALLALSATTSSAADTTPPTAPTGLTATAVSASQINLSWTASTDKVGVTGYRVERCQGVGCTTFAQIAAPTGTSFSDTGLTVATSYSYRVRAADAVGNLSTFSNIASATTPDTTAPTAPVALTATATSASQIDLSWTASTDNVEVTGYRIERCQGVACNTWVQHAAPTSTSFSDAGLAAATRYSYRVRATDAAGNLSGYSNVASATTRVAVAAQIYYLHPDHLNTPRLIANQAAATVWRWDQTEPFGSTPPNDDPDGDGVKFDFRLRFPGQYFDRETNLAYNFFRDYDPGIGRYVQSDPIGLRGGINTYLYVNGNPVSRTDPLGLVPIGTIPDDPNQAAIFYNFARPQPTSGCGCPPSIPLTPGQAIGGSLAVGAGAGVSAGLGIGLYITGAELATAGEFLGAAGALSTAGHVAITGLALGTAAGGVFGIALAGVIIANTSSVTSCSAQCPPCP